MSDLGSAIAAEIFIWVFSVGGIGLLAGIFIGWMIWG
jgi:hypothetical protein